MSDPTTPWIEELERRYGLPAELSRSLAPVLECLARQDLSEEQRAGLLGAIASAYQQRENQAREPIDEIRLLATQFLTELRKMEESFKVLDVMLQRVRAQMISAPRVLH